MSLLALCGAHARDNRSLTDFESGSSARIDTSDVPDTYYVAAVKEKLLVAQATIKNLSEGIAASNMESEIFKRQLVEANLRLEAIGLANLENDPSRLEARLLQAIRELRVLKEKKQAASEQLVRLSEAITILVKTSTNLKPEARMAVEAELRKAAEILGASAALAPDAVNASLQDAIVVDFKEDLSLLVANVGTAHGVKVGMPFRILRDGQLVGNAKVIDVRERISGAVIQNLASDTLRVEKGDNLRVDARK